MRIEAPRWFERLPIYRIMLEARAALKVRRWNGRGRPVPPPSAFKQQVLREYGKKYNLPTLIETGTLHGDTLFRLVHDFDRLYSIELSIELHAKAQERFRPFPNVTLIQGDSGAKMGEVVAGLKGPALFWLDGHYSLGDTAQGNLHSPILQELKTIFQGSPYRHVLLIDDARCFAPDWPADYPTLEELRGFVGEQAPGWAMEVADDIIRLTPPSLP